MNELAPNWEVSGKNRRACKARTILSLLVLGSCSVGDTSAVDLSARRVGDTIELSWLSQSLTKSAPYLHYEFQLQGSADLVAWTNVGAVLPGGVTAIASSPKNISVGVGGRADFFRLSYRFTGRNADLRGVDLSGVDLSAADLEGANLSGAILVGAQTAGANLNNANLNNARLGGADLGQIVGTPLISEIGGDQGASVDDQLPVLRYNPVSGHLVANDPNLPGLAVSRTDAHLLLAPGTTVGQLNDLLRQHNATVAACVPKDQRMDRNLLIVRLQTPNPLALFEACQQISTNPAVEGAAPEVVLGYDLITDSFGAMAAGLDWIWTPLPSNGNWGLEETRVPQMWNVYHALNRKGVERVPIAVIDATFIRNHEDLAVSIVGPAAIKANQHGMLVGGIIAATFSNRIGIDGVNPFTKLIGYNSQVQPADVFVNDPLIAQEPLAVSGYRLLESTRDLLRLEPATRIVNLSLGFNWVEQKGWNAGPVGQALELVKQVARTQGKSFAAIARQNQNVLFVCSAGNDSNKIEARFNSPPSNAALEQNATNVIVVESFSSGGVPTSASNRGGHVAAPGDRILSTSDGAQTYVTESGTSLASPFVAGVAGFLLAVDSQLKPAELISLLRKNGLNVDAFTSLLAIDNYPNRDKKILRMLLDFDDQTRDGNERVPVPAASLERDRSFDPIDTSSILVNLHWGDDRIDMADFRCWRDWYLSSTGNQLNAKDRSLKLDANGDGKLTSDDIGLFPRGDLNGDGFLHRTAQSVIPSGPLEGRQLTDLAVFAESGLWNDPHHAAAELPGLIDSVDLVVSARNLFAKTEALEEVEIWVYDGDTDARVGTSRRITRASGDEIITVKTGKKYYVGTEAIELEDDQIVGVRSLLNYNALEASRGADLAVDLVATEMTAIARAGEPLTEEVLGKPFDEEVDAHLPAVGTGQPLESTGARAWANSEGTFYASARSGAVDGAQPRADGMLTLSSKVVWRRTFVKFEDGPFKFNIKPLRLEIIDTVLDQLEMVASADLLVETRKFKNGSLEWEEEFRTLTEVRGYRQGSGGHTFKITRHEGDLAQQELIEIVDNSSVTGVRYTGEEYDGEIDLADVSYGNSFEVRYTLNAYCLAKPGDEFADAWVGDPLDYGSGGRSSYNGWGDLPDATGFSVNGAQAAITYNSLERFYYILYRTIATGSSLVPIAAKLGRTGSDQLMDGSAPAGVTQASYILENQPLDQPLDLDGDGIDDVYELNLAGFLHPLDGADAVRDFDGDGFTNLAEYQNGTDPAVPDAGPVQSSTIFPGTIVSVSPAYFLRAGDLNNDGRADLVTLTESFEGSLAVALANPDHTFQLPISSVIPGSRSVEDYLLAQLESDNNLDALVLDSGTRKLTVMRGFGNGRFEKSVELTISGVPTGLSIGDLNGDAKLDFIVPQKNFVLAIYASQPGGGWQGLLPLSVPSVPTHVGIGRFDADNNIDLAVTQSSGHVALLRGTANGSFLAPTLFPVGREPERVAVGDLNGDGRSDLVAVNKVTDDISVLLGNGDGTFAAEHRYPVGDVPADVQLSDLNNDGKVDVLVSHRGSDFHSLLLNQGTALSPSQPIYTDPTDRVVLFDWNGDARSDLATLLPDGQALILPGSSNGIFASRFQIDVSRASFSDLEVIDLNNDAIPEIVTLDYGQNFIDVWEHALKDRPARLVSSNSVSAQAERFVLSDFTGDQKVDIAVVSSRNEFLNRGENRLQILTGNGDGTFIAGVIIPLSRAPGDLLAGDFNGDGRVDLAVVNTFTGSITPFLNMGGGSFQEEPIVSAGDFISASVALDLDADGRPEIVVTGTRLGSQRFLKVLQRNQSGIWSERQSLIPTADIRSVAAGDVTGDGRPDLVTLSSATLSAAATLEYYPNTAGTLGMKVGLNSPGEGAFDVAIADVNRDSRSDILLSNGILLANPNGGFGSLQGFWLGDAGFIRAVDLNNDSRIDVVGLSNSAIATLMQ